MKEHNKTGKFTVQDSLHCYLKGKPLQYSGDADGHLNHMHLSPSKHEGSPTHNISESFCAPSQLQVKVEASVKHRKKMRCGTNGYFCRKAKVS